MATRDEVPNAQPVERLCKYIDDQFPDPAGEISMMRILRETKTLILECKDEEDLTDLGSESLALLHKGLKELKSRLPRRLPEDFEHMIENYFRAYRKKSNIHVGRKLRSRNNEGEQDGKA